MTSGSNSSEATSGGGLDDEVLIWRIGLFGIGGTIVAFVGLICNIVTIVVLAHYKTKSSAPFLLICLAVFDSIFLLSEAFLETSTFVIRHYIDDNYRDFIIEVYCYLFPLPRIARTCATYMVLTITLERFIVVVAPIAAHRICRRKVALCSVCAVVTFALVYHIPLYLAYSCTTLWSNKSQKEVTAFIRTEFGGSHFFVDVYFSWINLSLHFLFPFLVLLTLNSLMVRTLWYTRGGREGAAALGIHASQRSVQRERKLTIMVVCMTGVFFLCEMFPAIALILTSSVNQYIECSQACNRFSAIADVMIMINSAINFAIYCASGRKFREVFKQLFCGKSPKLHMSPVNANGGGGGIRGTGSGSRSTNTTRATSNSSNSNRLCEKRKRNENRLSLNSSLKSSTRSSGSNSSPVTRSSIVQSSTGTPPGVEESSLD